MRSWKEFKDDVQGFVDIGVGITIGVLFAGLMVIAYIIWTLRDQLLDNLYTPGVSTARANSSINNITEGFNNAVNLLLIVVVVWLLALAILALLVIKRKAA